MTNSLHTPVRILAIEPPDEDSTLAAQLAADDDAMQIQSVTSLSAARAVLSNDYADCVVCRHDPPRIDGLEALTTLRQIDPTLPVLFATTTDHADEAIRAGPTDIVQLTDGRLQSEVVTNRIESIVSQARQRGKYEQIFEQASDGIFIHDPETGDILEANRRCYELLGYDPEAADRLSLAQIVSGVDGYTEAAARDLIRAVASEGTKTVEWLAETANGSHAWTESNLESVQIAGNRRVLSFVRDITDRKEKERLLRESRTTLQHLHAITSSPERSFEEQVSAMLSFGSDHLDMDLGYLARTDEDAGSFEIVSTHGEHDQFRPGFETTLDETYCRLAIGTTETPVAIPDVAASDRIDTATRQRFGFESYFSNEIVVDGDSYGTLCFADETVRDRPFTDAERTLLDIMVQWLGQELSKREYRTELEVTRDRLERTLERVDDAFLAVDRDWQLTYVNDAGATALRDATDAENTESLLGRRLWEIVPDAVGSNFYDRYHEALDTQEPVTFEEYFEPIDTWFQVRAYPDDDGLSVYFTDVTERKARERTLDELLEVTQQFHRASTTDDLFDAIVDAVDEVFGYGISSVRLHDANTGTLPPTRYSAAAQEQIPDPPVYDDDEALLGRAFQTDEPVVVDDIGAETDYDYGPVRSTIAVPLGEHGVLSVGATDAGAFDGEDASLVELLAVTATAALDRVDREREMRQLRHSIAHVDEMVFLLDDDDRFAFVTGPLASYLGRDRADLLGTPLTDVLTPADGRRCDGLLDTIRDDDASTSVEVDITTAAGRQRPVHLELSATTGGRDEAAVAGVVTDISELTETRGSLAMERERFWELFTNLPDPIAEITFEDGEPLVESLNPAFSDVFGYDETTLSGRNLNEFVVPEGEHHEARQLDEQLLIGNRTSVELQRTTDDGLRDFLVRAIPYRIEDTAYGFVVYTDITAQKERERYFQVLNRVLRHNLRNDLTVILGLARHLADTVEDADLVRQAEMLQSNAQQVTSLVEKAKAIEDLVGSDDHEVGVIDLAPHLRDTVADLRETYPGTSIMLDIPDTLRARCTGDITRAVTELVENAVEHAGESPVIRIEASTDAASGEWVTLSVRDDGSGVPNEEWETVVGDTDITQLSHGTGLGLWLTRWIVESFGGGLHRRPDDDGATVVITLERPAA